jgi:hypothetical protein
VDRIPGAVSQGLAVELWDAMRILEMFYTSASLLYDEFNAPEIKSALDNLMIIPAAPVSSINYTAIAKKYKLKIKDPLSSPNFVGPMPPVGDFWDFVQARTKRVGVRLDSLRHDWLKIHPQLLDWDGSIVAAETIHAEVKLAVDCLSRGRRGPVCIGVSKQPCFCCEKFFDAWNDHSKKVKFHLAAGHKKVYPGWRPSGIDAIDKVVIEKIWEVVDALVSEVKRIESKDLVAASPLSTQKVVFENTELTHLLQIIDHWNAAG